jgi:hypothetical protein
LVAIGPGQICVPKNTDDPLLTKISHGDTYTTRKSVDNDRHKHGTK